MNSFLFTAITLCLAGQSALAHYQSGAAPAYGNGYQQQQQYHQQQRKMAPMPQTYGSNYGAAMESQSYGEQHYEQPAAAPAYRAPSSASVSQYDERVPAASSSYNKQPAPVAAYGRQSGGYSAPSSGYAKPAAPKYEEPYHPPTPFAWGYDINDGYGGAQYHKENGDEYGKRTGSYGYTDAYGIYRQVDYVADEHGFRATIKTNEPGTANESPADVEMHAYEPPSNYYAGKQESYGKQSSSYAPSSSSSSYGGASSAPSSASSSSSSYGAPAASSYSAPRGQSYGSSAARSSYKQQQQSSSGYGSAAPARYEQAAQYSSSSPMPVYQRKATAAVAPKRY